MVALGALFGAYAIDNAQDRTDVLVVTRTVAAGEPFTTENVGVRRIAVADGVSFVRGDELPVVMRRVARVTLLAGQLLPRGAVVAERSIEAGSTIVALALEPGQAPPLRVGDSIFVIPLDRNSGGAEPIAATVFSLDSEDESSRERVVSVLTAEDNGPDIAAAAASGNLSVIVRGGQ